MNMASVAALYAMIILAILPSPATPLPLPLKKSNHIFMFPQGNDDLIESTCKNTPNYQLCISTLRSDPRSRNTDVYGLGLVVVDAVAKAATAAVERINKLKDKEGSSSNQDFILPLLKCNALYNAILKADIPEAIEGLRKGVPKFAEMGMDDAALEVEICESGFIHSNSPLTGMNRDVYDLSVVAKSIIRILL